MGDKIDRPMLCQHWIHSHEEDTETEAVYRPSKFSFPPARGRKGFELSDDGTLVEYAIGPSDRPLGKPGQWKLDGDQMAMYTESDDEPTSIMTITAVDSEKLVLRKGG